MYCRSCYWYMYVGFTLASQQHPALEDLLLKIPLEKLSILHTVFLKNRLQINKNNYRVINANFCVQTSQSAKNYFDPTRNENQPKSDIYILFARKQVNKASK